MSVNKLSESELMNKLADMGVVFPKAYTIIQLRRLYTINVTERKFIQDKLDEFELENPWLPIEYSLTTDTDRCNNCCQIGHLVKECEKPKRPLNGCLHCFEVGHQHSECPNGPIRRMTPEYSSDPDVCGWQEEMHEILCSRSWINSKY